MVYLRKRCSARDNYDDRLILPFELRQRSRSRVKLESGEEAVLALERGSVLRGGDCLQADDGRIVRVVAAAEETLKIESPSVRELTRAAYHLGNRHVALEIGEGLLRLAYDPVLARMLEGLGAATVKEFAPFEPEVGAYGHAGHSDKEPGEHEHGATGHH
jgi:urease accessory protein